MIERLPKEFKGKGDVSNYYYTQVYSHKLKDGRYAYIYEQKDVSVDSYVAGYEVVKPRISNKMKIENVGGKMKYTKLEELKEYYPSSEEWGVNAYTCRSYDDALKKILVFEAKSAEES